MSSASRLNFLKDEYLLAFQAIFKYMYLHNTHFPEFVLF